MGLKHLLIIGKTWPEPDSSAAGSRMMQLIRLFTDAGDWKISFASTAMRSAYAVDLEKLGVDCFALKLNNSTVHHLFTEEQPDVVIFDRFMTEEQFGWRIAETCPNALRVLDTEDLHFLRRARELAFQNGSTARKERYNPITYREIASVLRVDLTLVISEAEMILLKESFGIAESTLFYLPFLMKGPKNGFFDRYPSFQERKDFAFIGNFKHSPNTAAVLALKRNIWPAIRAAMPDAQMRIGGAYPTSQIRQLHRPKEGFWVVGRVANLNEFLQNTRVLLAPLRFGAGLKGKFFDAMMNGTPSVTTPIGAEGIGDRNHFPGRITKTDKEFITASVTLYTNPELWTATRDRAYELIRRDFTKDLFEPLFFKRIKYLLDNLDELRGGNFWQGLILQHRLQSTKYMSRWIEVKNNINTDN